MITEYRYNNVVKPILETYNDIEDELLQNIARALKETDLDEVKKQTKRLLKASELDRQNVRTLSKYSKLSQRQVKKAFSDIGYDTIEKPLYRKAYEKKLIKKDPMTAIDNKKIAKVVDNATKETTNYLKNIRNTAKINSKKKYLEIVNKAYLETSTGIYTPEESIKRALHQLADEGITAVQYKRDGKLVNYSIEGVVRRDVLTRARQLGLQTEMERIKDLGIEYVSVPAHLGARVDEKNPINNHAGWQGKIYKLNGGNSKYKNFYEVTGYGQMLGLGGVNCRHFFLPYIFGVSKPPEKINMKANEQIYKLEQKQRALERDVRKWKKRLLVDKANGDTEEQIAFDKMKVREKQSKLNKFVKSHSELKRQYDREYVQELNKIINENEIEKVSYNFNKFRKSIDEYSNFDYNGFLEEYKKFYNSIDKKEIEDAYEKYKKWLKNNEKGSHPIGELLNKKTEYDKLPELIDEKEFGNMLFEDDKHLYRGVKGKTIKDTQKYVKDFKTGEYYAGIGISGNGSYATTNWDEAMRYSEGFTDGLIYIMPKDNAKIVDIAQLAGIKYELNQMYWGKDELFNNFTKVIFEDNGYLAQILGYDIIERERIKIILNRGAIKVVK